MRMRLESSSIATSTAYLPPVADINSYRAPRIAQTFIGTACISSTTKTFLQPMPLWPAETAAHLRICRLHVLSGLA
jgi:hypothetical protein